MQLNKVTLIIGDDHPMFLRGLKDLILEDSQIDLLGTAKNGNEALNLIINKKPKIAVLDLDMPQISGLEVAKEVNKNNFGTNIIILTMHDEEGRFSSSIEAGVSGYILKDSAASEILSAIHAVADGKNYISPFLSHYLIKKDPIGKKGNETKLGIESLTSTEKKVVSLIAHGKSSKEIADLLFISIKTVAAHRSNICIKLNLHGTNALLKFAMENKHFF